MGVEPIYEHPDDWNMHEGQFAKQCSQLGYRLLSLADRTRNRALIPSEAEALLRINTDLRAIGG